MGGFEWLTKVPTQKYGGMERVKTELTELAKDPSADPYLRYLAQELSEIWIVKPEERDETCWYEIKQALWGKVRIPRETYGENFGKEFPGEGEILLYCWEIPWLWKFPPEIIATVASIFEKHDVIDVWWAIYWKRNSRQRYDG